MKTKVLLVMVGAWICSVVSLSAQSIQTATLQKDDGVQVFYGADALINAVNAAQDGNIIYLSAGTFNGVQNLAKSIKIIGAGGFNADETKNTVINGNMSISRIAESYADYLGLEEFVVKNDFNIGNTYSGDDNSMIKIKKIKFESNVQFYTNSGNFFNIEISQCVFKDLSFHQNANYTNIVISNSIIAIMHNFVSTSSTILIANTILFGDTNWAFSGISLQNNIIVTNQNNNGPNSVYNNIFTGANNFPSVSNQSGNWENVTLSDLFVNQPENKWDPSYDYHLKNPNNYIGTDGSQVGIYGGLFPWNPVPSNPQIIESKVNPTTTNDGKLNFQIKAEAQQ